MDSMDMDYSKKQEMYNKLSCMYNCCIYLFGKLFFKIERHSCVMMKMGGRSWIDQ